MGCAMNVLHNPLRNDGPSSFDWMMLTFSLLLLGWIILTG
jgi:hypothetical protein